MRQSRNQFVRARASVLALLLAAAAFLVGGASPAFAHPQDAPWTGGGTAGDTVVSDGAEGPAQFNYNVPVNDNNGESGTWFFETTAGSAGDVDVDWTYAGFHAYFSVTVSLEAYITPLGGVESVIATPVSAGPTNCCTSPSNGFSYSGTTTFPTLAPGDTYGFRMSGSNGDSNDTLVGTLTIDPFTVAAEIGSASLPAGTATTGGAVFTSDDHGQELGSIFAVLPADFSYVAGSSRFYDPLTGDYTDTAPGDPSIAGQELDWTANGPFLIDPVDGLEIRFGMTAAGTATAGARVLTVGARQDGFVASSTASVTVAATQPGDTLLQQAVPLGGDQTGVVGRLVTPGPATGELRFDHAPTCTDGALDSATQLGTFPFAAEGTGELFFALAVDNAFPASSGFIAASYEGGAAAPCIALGPDNDSWVRALDIPLSPTGMAGVNGGGANGVLDSSGQARWYRFDISPGARATIDLSDLPADYDLAVFKDISQAYTDLSNPIEDLNRLSAEFAPSVFSPSVFSPSVFSPSVFSPDAYAPSVFSPSVFSPSVFSPSVFSPSVFSPSVFSPSVFSPSVFSPSVFSPSVFSPSVFSPSVFSPSVFSPSVFSPSVFSPDNFSSAQQRSLIAVSAQPGTGDELVVADTWNNTGSFYVRVSGRNGAFAPGDDFSLDVELDGALCDGVSSMGAVPGHAAAGGVDTVIVWDSTRVSGTANEIATLGAKLDELAGANGLTGVVIDTSTDSRIESLQVQATATPSCVYAKNLVADGVKDIVDSYRANNSLDYVVLVGGDDAIPFFRYPDQALLGPEQDYDPPVQGASAASLKFNYILGQDEYGSRIEISRGDGTIPIPDLAVGRLVETAAEITGMIDLYLGAPTVTPSSSLVTGYDFLTDAADAVDAEFDAGLGAGGTANRLVDPADQSPDDPASWTAADLKTALFDSGRNDLIFLAGHFSANSALAADYETSVITTELATSSVDMENTLVFSAGCHSGYNIVLGDTVPGVTLPLDWAQAFAQKGATLIGGTGYQYGDTDFVEYSERLYADFARELRTGTGARPVGQALVDAKVNYLESTPDMRGLHRKAIIISTVFGLPMLGVDMPGERIIDPVDASVVGGTTAFTANPGSALGTSYYDHSVNPTNTLQSVSLNPLDGSAPILAEYYRGDDGVVTNPAEPAIPLVSTNVSVPGQVLRGVGFRGGSYAESTVVPLTGAPATELRGVHTPFASQTFFPMRMNTVNYFGELSADGQGTRLNTTPAQHRVTAIGDVESTLRLFDQMDVRLYYSANTATIGSGTNAVTPALAGPPTLSAVRAEVVGNDITFEARAVGDPAAGIQEVWVTYTHGAMAGTGEWLPIDLVPDPADSTRWTGILPGGASAGSLDFIAHAANGVGLVASDDNFGSFYRVSVDGAAPTPAATTLSITANPGSGQFGTSAPVAATLASNGGPVVGQTVIFTIGGSTRAGVTDSNGVATATLPLTSLPGSRRLTVSSAGTPDLAAARATAPFAVHKSPTTLTLTAATDPVPPGESTGIVATLTDGSGGPLTQRTIYFSVAGAVGSRTVARITNLQGQATLGPLALPGGSFEVTARFLGTVTLFPTGELVLSDSTYSAASAIQPLQMQTIVSPVTVVESVLPLGTAVDASASILPVSTGSHTATWDWGDGTTSVANLTSTGDVAAVNDSHTYADPGVYEVTLIVVDAGGLTSTSTFQYAVVYDPVGGFVTGGGWIDSPVGAYLPDPTLTGKASFGFVAKYKKGQSIPSGTTQFKFKAAGLTFESVSYDWLVIAGTNAKYKGRGTINGAGDYGFMLTGKDGDSKNGGVDEFRIKIWDRASGGIVYDNKMGADDSSNDGTALGGGSIQVHKAK